MDHVDSEALRVSPYFLELNAAELEWLRRNAEIRGKDRGAVLLLEGAESPGLLIVLSGSLKVCRVSPSGREQVLRIVGRGESLNDVPVFDGGTCPATVIALEDSEVLIVPAPVFRELLARHTTVAVELLQTLAQRLRQVTRLATDLTLMDVEGRVAKALDVYTRASASREFPLTQIELASIVGARREVVARALKDLEEHGTIAREHGHIAVIERDRLVAMQSHGQDRT